MKVHGSIFVIIQIVLVLGGLALIGGLLFYFNDGEVRDAASDTETEAHMLRLQGSASVHFGRFYAYDTMCSEAGVPEGIVCNADETQYAFEARMKDGTYYCVDSNKFEGTRSYSIHDATSCGDL